MYTYGRIRIPSSRLEYEDDARGEEMNFLVYVHDADGEVAWAAWCRIPRSTLVADRAMVRLGLANHVHMRSSALGVSTVAGVIQPALADSGDDCPWEGSYWDEAKRSCVIPLDPIGNEGGGGGGDDDPLPPPPPPPPPPDDQPTDPPGGGGDTPPPPPDWQDPGRICRTSNTELNSIAQASIFYTVWWASNPRADLLDRQEIAGWIVKTSDGRYVLKVWPYQGTVCGILKPDDEIPPLPGFGQIVGIIHSHPYKPGDMIPNCSPTGYPLSKYQLYVGGASDLDGETSELLGALVPHPNYPGPLQGYIVDETGIITFTGANGITSSHRDDRCGY